jgi:hypothetical protein
MEPEYALELVHLPKQMFKPSKDLYLKGGAVDTSNPNNPKLYF